ncbi:Uncharacterised protein [Mycobacterium tuberculosis]|uniref:Uncharacterized protein n=1 Tax=Mycobacterium tuberculosis TaxID=1773 RepID=A0A0U0U6M9_MYCTX|nr:Uncharacterised protein [Mycobacterium tuberculosis]COX59603.1 Uncharacterised protein [Mycobacterium tuberculosis]COY53974.1 Uncharacterised protein [Mycobacterium tuberculosis]
MMRATRDRRYGPVRGCDRRSRAAAACPRHNKNPDTAKNTATARSKRPNSRPPTPLECPVWNAT